jgi:CHAD domain-containing protein
MNRANPPVTTALLARRARALKRHLAEAAAGNGVGVHQARVASRRLRETVPVLATGLKDSKAEKARRKIRRITRALGAIRELDVTMALVDELVKREGVPRLALEDVRAHVMKEQERRREVMLKRLGRVNVDKLDKRLTSLAQTLEEAGTDDWRDALSSRLLKRAKALQDAAAEAGQLYEAERLHAVRIAAKKLRYSAELAAESGVKAANQPVRTIKRAQDTLGRLHDVQVLQTHVAAVQALPPRASGAEGGLDIISRQLEEECRHLHARYLSTVGALQSAIDDIQAVVVPQLARRRKSRGPLKMKLDPAAPRIGSAAKTSAGVSQR